MEVVPVNGSHPERLCSAPRLGILFKDAFPGGKDFYAAVTSEHVFQTLMLDVKPSEAFRKGIYLTRVEETPDGDAHFRVLRCSTNLAGPTENLRPTDVEILARVNDLRSRYFEGTAELNHVLAQTYHNTVGPDGKQKKAKISSHSDKTKDMPSNAVMAFCTFYDAPAPAQDALTKLRFRAKDGSSASPSVVDVVLHPNSVFMMPLESNRLYTHEIVPSTLPVDRIPTRLGYVVRSSTTEAVHRNGQTYLDHPNGRRVLLQPPDDEGVRLLRELYYLENTTARTVDYDTANRFPFSLNAGDYLRPTV